MTTTSPATTTVAGVTRDQVLAEARGILAAGDQPSKRGISTPCWRTDDQP